MCLVLIGSVLACVSSVPLDAGYGVPVAPVLVPAPALVPQVNNILLPADILNPSLSNDIINRNLNIGVTRVVPAPFIPPQQVAVSSPLSFPPQSVVVPQPFAAPIPAPVVPSVVPPSSQFHAQDEFGQFSFGFQNINSARSESKDAFGVTRGSYQYVDANNIVQTVHYTADDINGFRVAATNVPVAPLGLPVAPEAPVSAPLVAPVAVVETPEVAAARAEHLAAHEQVKAEAAAAVVSTERKRRDAEPIEALYGVPAAPVLVPQVNNILLPTSSNILSPSLSNDIINRNLNIGVSRVVPPFVASQPIAVPAPFIPPQQVAVSSPLSFPPQSVVIPQPFAAPIPAPVVPSVVPPSSQFHAQDEFGQFSFGYQNINSARSESK